MSQADVEQQHLAEARIDLAAERNAVGSTVQHPVAQASLAEQVEGA